jgi:hypothetical protein
MHERTWGWISLHEEQPRNELNAANPFLGGMATSSPLGDLGDDRDGAWGLHPGGGVRNQSLHEFCDRAEFTRSRLALLVDVAEALPKWSGATANSVGEMLSELSVLHSEFHSLRGSPHAWQNIYAGDAMLMARATRALHELLELQQGIHAKKTQPSSAEVFPKAAAGQRNYLDFSRFWYRRNRQ